MLIRLNVRFAKFDKSTSKEFDRLKNGPHYTGRFSLKTSFLLDGSLGFVKRVPWTRFWPVLISIRSCYWTKLEWPPVLIFFFFQLNQLVWFGSYNTGSVVTCDNSVGLWRWVCYFSEVLAVRISLLGSDFDSRKACLSI